MSSSDQWYKTDYPYRGTAYIVNNENFSTSSGLPQRVGAKSDSESLKASLEHLDFSVTLKHDLTAGQIQQLIKDEARADHSQDDCFLLAILTHGGQDCVYGTDGKAIRTEAISEPFKPLKSLVGKPKIFIFQACLAEKIDLVEADGPTPGPSPSSKVPKVKLPVEADFLYAYSTLPDHAAQASKQYGSTYICELARLLKDQGRQVSFTHLLTNVNRMVIIDNQKSPNSNQPQVPSYYSTLTKKLRFPVKYDESMETDEESLLEWYPLALKRGMAIIVNNETFVNLRERKGTDLDRDALKKSLEKLNFAVTTWDNLTAARIREVLEAAAQADHSSSECFVFAILTHGGENDESVYGSDDEEIKITDIWKPFRSSRFLKQKPKIFIFQACWGKQLMVTVESDGPGEPPVPMSPVEEGGEPPLTRVPDESDFLFAFSTLHKYYSFRHNTKGAWYIQELASVLASDGETMNFTDLLAKVNLMMVSQHESKTKDMLYANGRLQVGVYMSTLTRNIKFPPKSNGNP